MQTLWALTAFLCLIAATSADGAPRCDSLLGPIVDAIQNARLSEARALALDLVSDRPDCERTVAGAYVQAADARLTDGGEYLERVEAASYGGTRKPLAKRDAGRCWDGAGNHDDASEAWDRCCSLMPHRGARTAASRPSTFAAGSPPLTTGLGGDDCVGGATKQDRLCCEMFHGSPSHLRLPALRELAVNLRVSFDGGETRVLSLEQDGFLRPFDMSAVLWPAGYLLTLCVAAPIGCGAPEVLRAVQSISSNGSDHPVAIELGSGIGAPSIALALNLRNVFFGDRREGEATRPLVVAADWSPWSLALILANKNANDSPVATAVADHMNATSLAEVRKRFFPQHEEDSGHGGFALVIGASLQAFFDGTEKPGSLLWKALDTLLDPANPEAAALLTHTKAEPVRPPDDGSFRLVRRVSGDAFGMQTRKGASSDFVISVFRRAMVGAGESRDGKEL